MQLLLIILLIIILIGVLPAWPYANTWGYWPSGTVLLVILILVLLMLFGSRGP